MDSRDLAFQSSALRAIGPVISDNAFTACQGKLQQFPKKVRFDPASVVVSAPASPHCAAQIMLIIDGIVSGNSLRLPGLGILARCDHCMGVSGSNGLVAFTCVKRSIGGEAAEVLIGLNLFQKFG